MEKLPEGPVTIPELDALGFGAAEMARLVRRGALRRVFRGVFVSAGCALTPELRCRCLAKVLPPNAVVCDHTAAGLWGIDVHSASSMDAPPDVDVVLVGAHRSTRLPGTFGGKRALTPDDVVTLHGIQVTSPLRTACDLACRRSRRQALAVLDAFARAHGLTKADYRRMARRFRGRRGVVQLRELIEYVDPRAESIRESWVRIEIVDSGLPVPDLQVWVELPGLGRVRLDLAYRGRRIAIEYDGEEFHSSPAARSADELRRRLLREAGWIVIVVRREDLKGERLDAWLGLLRRSYDERSPARTRRYASAPRERRPLGHRR